MKQEKIQQIIINKLLDKYEKSKTFTGDNKVTQSFEKRIAEVFPKYTDDAEYELFCEINEAMVLLERKGLITIKFQRVNIISKVALNPEMADECYYYVGREPRKTEQEWIKDVICRIRGCVILDKYADVQLNKITKNQKVEYYDGNKSDFCDLLKLITELSQNEEEQFVRDFSIKLFKDSKRIERLSSKAAALMYQYGDFLDKESVLEECGIVNTPTYVCMKGQGALILGNQKIDLSMMKGDIALSTASLKELNRVVVYGRRVITIENLTSFHDYAGTEDFVIYLGGFHNKTKREFLRFLYTQNTDVEYRHFGDIDAGGFYILEHLKAKTGIPFRSIYMDIQTLKKYSSQTIELSGNDRKRLERLLSKINVEMEQSGLSENYSEVLQYMLSNNCKLEQEVVR